MSLELGGYDPDFFPRLMKIEDEHFWFVSRNFLIETLVTQIVPAFSPDYQVLEVGCGTGNTLRILEQVCREGVVTGVDLYPEALQYARRRVACALIAGDIYNQSLRTSFDLIGLFDVLEHIPDDISTLVRLHEMLLPSGLLCLTVPAHPSLWSYFDEASHHCRRYQLRELNRKLKETGYQVEYISYFMASIFPLVWLKRRLSEVKRQQNIATQSSDDLVAAELRIVPGLNQILTWFLKQEARLVGWRWKLPMGTSIVAIARKI
jgi:SAM-dependent methyltransferase